MSQASTHNPASDEGEPRPGSVVVRREVWLGDPPGMRCGWGWLLLALLITAGPMLAGLSQRDPTRTMEKIVLLRSQETWLRLHGEAGFAREPNAWLLPTHWGEPAVTKPPLVVWMNLLVWGDLTPAEADTLQLTSRARWASVVMGMVLVTATWWLGVGLGGRSLGGFAAVIVASMYLVIHEARQATYDMPLAAWVTLALASSVWALRPWREGTVSTSRAAAGWALAGVCLGLAYLSKGPLSVLLYAWPLTMVLVLSPGRGWRRWTGPLLAGAVTAAVAGPWYAYIFQNVPQVTEILAEEYAAERTDPQPPWYYAGLLLLAAPWTVWLIAGLCQPFARAADAERRRLLVAWGWFVGLLIVLSIPEAKQQRYVLPLTPAIALLAAEVWRAHAALAHPDPGVKPLMRVHWLAMLIAAVALTGSLLWPGLLQRVLDAAGVKGEPVFAPVAWWLVLGVGGIAIAAAAAGWRWHERWRVPHAATATAVAAAAMMSLALYARADAWTEEIAVRQEALRVAAIVGLHDVYYLRHPDVPDRQKLHHDFLINVRRVVPRIESGRPPRRIEQTTFVIAMARPPHDDALTAAGYRIVLDHFEPKAGQAHRLWRCDPAANAVNQ
jgi:4-amino-4-deoxy-L-arabinose transferase-like glycosyltransferase